MIIDDLIQYVRKIRKYGTNISNRYRGLPEFYRALVQYLQTENADINAYDKGGYTALAWAASGGCKQVVHLLLQSGAAINLKNKSGDTPLIWAASYGCHEMVEFLLEQDAKIDTQDDYGCTALEWAACAQTYYGARLTTELLIKRGADLNKILGCQSFTFVGRPFIFQILERAGRKVCTTARFWLSLGGIKNWRLFDTFLKEAKQHNRRVENAINEASGFTLGKHTRLPFVISDLVYGYLFENRTCYMHFQTAFNEARMEGFTPPSGVSKKRKRV